MSLTLSPAVGTSHLKTSSTLLFTYPLYVTIHLGVGFQEVNGVQSIGQSSLGKQGVELSVADAAKLGGGAEPSTPGLRDKVMDRVPVDRSLAKLTHGNCVSDG